MKISVVIPYHEREYAQENLRRVLASLKDQGYGFSGAMFNPRDYLKTFRETREQAEIIIVSDAASPPEYRHNVCHKMNVGIKMARGDVVMVLQQEVMLNPDALNNAIGLTYKYPRSIFYPLILKEHRKGEDQPCPYKPHQGAFEKSQIANFCLFCEREDILELRGFDEDFAGAWGYEDYEFLDRVKYNYPVLFGYSSHDYRDHWGVVGTHLWHPEAPDAIRGNSDIYEEKIKNPDRVANEGREWGVLYDGKND